MRSSLVIFSSILFKDTDVKINTKKTFIPFILALSNEQLNQGAEQFYLWVPEGY